MIPKGIPAAITLLANIIYYKMQNTWAVPWILSDNPELPKMPTLFFFFLLLWLTVLLSDVENLCGFKLPIFERINWHLTVLQTLNQFPKRSPKSKSKPNPKTNLNPTSNPLIILNYTQTCRPFSKSLLTMRMTRRTTTKVTSRATLSLLTCWPGWLGGMFWMAHTTQLRLLAATDRVSQNKIKIKAKFNLSKIDYRPIMCSLREPQSPYPGMVSILLFFFSVFFFPETIQPPIHPSIHLCLAIRHNFYIDSTT